MARYDEITQSNWLTKREKLIRKSTNIILAICLIDMTSLLFSPIRKYHFNNFPNFHLIGVSLLFIIVLIRIFQARNEGKDPSMEASREWRERKDMLGPYDFVGPGPDYSNKKYNSIYYIGVIISFCLMIIEVIKNISLK